jgi:hypothetical protein
MGKLSVQERRDDAKSAGTARTLSKFVATAPVSTDSRDAAPQRDIVLARSSPGRTFQTLSKMFTSMQLLSQAAKITRDNGIITQRALTPH